MYAQGVQANHIQLKYPVLLVHGSAFRDTMLGIAYWGRIPERMQENGVQVFYGGTDAWGTIEHNANILKTAIETIIKTVGTEKVNVIAHSRGGLEARYLISSLKQHTLIASLTSISTPHKGIKALNYVLYIPNILYRTLAFFVDFWYGIMGDKNPDFFTSSSQLSEKACREFNKANPDSESVYYQSYTAKMNRFYNDLFFMFLYLVLLLSDGESDGICPVESAKWGNFRGVVTTNGGVSHTGIIDFCAKGIYPLPAFSCGDIPEFYLSILKDLADNGY